jgi:Asp-tRNA(Asn)/Glu-tRNA(Gln) amidotransferase C subunit
MPSLTISPEWFAQLQEWARIAPSAEDEYIRAQLNRQLSEEVAKLFAAEVDLSAVTPTTWGLDVQAHAVAMRDDVVQPWPDVDALLDAGPDGRRVVDRYFVVPAADGE